jgi:hypothetical protein
MVDFSNSALTTSLHSTADGSFTHVRIEMAMELGAANIPHGDDGRFWGAVKDQIWRTTKLPVQTSDYPWRGPLNEITSVVLYGDATDDARFQAVLKDALFGVKVAKAARSDAMKDPVFAAAEGAAIWMWPRMELWPPSEEMMKAPKADL